MPDQGLSVPVSIDMVQLRMDVLGNTAPPAITSGSNVTGTADTAARSDHTHKSSVQRQRVSVPLTAGRGAWTFATPYDVSIVPVVQVTAETPNDNTYFYDARIVSGTVTNTGVQIMVNKINATQTLGGSLAALLGAVVNIFAPATGTVVVHCWAAPATA